jgi:leader peptidase (prepilin peptidase)/N-methyltransferase
LISLSEASSTDPLLVAGTGLIGLMLSPVAELLIFKFLPRLGSLPTIRTRSTTAIVTGVLCAAFAFRFGIEPELPAFILLGVLGVQLARIDISLHLLPNPLVLSLLLGGLICLISAAGGGQDWTDLVRAAASAAILFATYLILALISPNGIGMGDVKFAAPVGLYLGYLGWSQLLYGGLVGFILNGIVTLLLVRMNRAKRPSEVPHGPTMLAAMVGITLFMV